MKDGQDTFGAHERGLSGRLSAGCCSGGQEDETELRSDRRRGGKTRSAKQRDGKKTKKNVAPTKQLDGPAQDCN